MIYRFCKKSTIIFFAALVALFSVGSAHAQDVSDYTITKVVAPTGDWKELVGDGADVYQLLYTYTEGEDSAVEVELEMGTEGSVIFNVFTIAQAREWTSGQEVEPLGTGSPINEDTKTRLRWRSGAASDEIFFIIVRNERSEASYYELTITGNGVAYPAGIALDAAAPAPTAEEANEREVEPAADAANTEAKETETVATEPASTSGPRIVGTPTGEWLTIGPRQFDGYQVLYKFIEGEESFLYAELEMTEAGAVEFYILNDALLNDWRNGLEIEPLGRGTAIDDDELVIAWANRSAGSETFYIAVRNMRDVPTNYKLTVSGNGITFPLGNLANTAAPEAVEATVEPTAEAAQSDAASTEEGATSNDRLSVIGAPVGDWLEIAPRRVHAYQVNYHFAEAEDGSTSNVTVKLEMGEAGDVNFYILTPDRVDQYRKGEDIEPLGAGSPINEDTETKLIWTSATVGDEILYVLVENNRDVPSYYTIDISGSGITFPLGTIN